MKCSSYLPICLKHWPGLVCVLLSVACATTEPTPSIAQNTPVATAVLIPSTTPIPTATAVIPPTSTLPPTSTSTPLPSPTPTPLPSPAPTNSATATQTPIPPVIASATPALTITNLSTLADDTEVTVTGQVVAAATFSAGFKFTLDDGTGQVILLLWHNVYDECWDAPILNLGASVRVTGKIGRFNNELQIEPTWGGDVFVLTPGNSTAPQVAINTLAEHLGQRVMITGSILRTEGSNSGVSLFVMDESGEVAVFLWRNVLDRIPNNVPLGVPGTQVQITGWVQEFRSNRQVLPTLPYDVVVLP